MIHILWAACVCVILFIVLVMLLYIAFLMVRGVFRYTIKKSDVITIARSTAVTVYGETMDADLVNVDINGIAKREYEKHFRRGQRKK